jgi:small subunit ribosomal protein S4
MLNKTKTHLTAQLPRKILPKSHQLTLRNLELTQIVPVPDWLTVDRDALKGKVAHIPSRDEMQPMVNEQLIVELYSR